MDTKEVYDKVRAELEEEGEDEDLADFVSEGEEDLNLLEPEVEFDDTFPESVFLTGLPKVAEAKYSKLLSVVSKVIDKSGKNDKVMPIKEETKMTEGFVIVTFETAEAAKHAVESLDGFRLDKQNTFKAVLMDDYNKIISRSDEFVAERTLTSFSRADFRDWLTDKKCREQILLRYQTETEIYWHDTMVGMPVLQYGGEKQKAIGNGYVWCDWRVQWSPQGSYLATYHYQGVALWSGDQFDKKVRLPHERVKAIEFSPTEDYALLWNGSSYVEKDDKAYVIYHILTGQCVKTLKTPMVAPLGEQHCVGGVPEFPHFLWSPDGKFFAECSDSRIVIRDTDTFEIIKDESGKQSHLKFDQLSTFQWSPKDNVIAAWTLEKDNNPARLVLMEIPSRKELASRSRTQCEASMHWQSEGDYLCLLVTKLSKTNKKMSTNLEIFRMRERGIPVDTVTVNDNVRGFFWETKGDRFAVLAADEANQKNPKLMIFVLKPDKIEEICCFDLPSNSFNNLFWAPDGQYFVCAATGQSGGDLIFAGVDANNKLEVCYKDDHYMLTDVKWDPSSRYVITAVTQPHANESGGYRFNMEAGYKIRTFQGRVLYSAQKEKLYEVFWRPHPPSALSTKKQKDIRKNIKQWSKKYDAIDDRAKDAARQAFKRDREEKTNSFLSVLNRLQEWKAEKEEDNGWSEAMEEFFEGQGWMQDEQAIEEELDVTEELIA